MTEEEWLTATDPEAMLEVLRGKGSDRKFVLTASDVCRRLCRSHPLPVLLTMLAVCERWADGRMAPGEINRVVRVAVPRFDSTRPAPDDPLRSIKRDAAYCTMSLLDLVAGLGLSGGGDSRDQVRSIAVFATEQVPEFAPVIRCVFGNPIRPVSLAPSWLTSTVVCLATGIYAERAFDRLPILADALQDAGCDDAEILNHCRSDGPHVRGCWVVDLLLGKE